MDQYSILRYILEFIGIGGLSVLASWLFFWKTKVKNYQAKTRKETVEYSIELYDQVDERIDVLSKRVLELNEKWLESEQGKQLFKSHLGILFNHCHCDDSDVVAAIRRKYYGDKQVEESESTDV